MVSKKLVEYACQMASDIDAGAVLIYADVANAIEDIEKIFVQFPLRFIVALRSGELSCLEGYSNVSRIAVPDVPMTRLGQVKVALLVSLARGIIKKGSRVVLMTGIERSQVIDTIMVLNLETESELISMADPLIVGDGIEPEVFERVLTLAAEIAFEGREGHQVGTIFVIGDSAEVLRRTENLVLNPFYGYSRAERHIMDSRMEETLKEFSTIDGAFVISGDGTVETAGARILTSSLPIDLPVGLGTRHAAAAAITLMTSSISICISQSTGNMTVYRGGRLVAEVPKPSPERRFL